MEVRASVWALVPLPHPQGAFSSGSNTDSALVLMDAAFGWTDWPCFALQIPQVLEAQAHLLHTTCDLPKHQALAPPSLGSTKHWSAFAEYLWDTQHEGGRGAGMGGAGGAQKETRLPQPQPWGQVGTDGRASGSCDSRPLESL